MYTETIFFVPKSLSMNKLVYPGMGRIFKLHEHLKNVYVT